MLAPDTIPVRASEQLLRASSALTDARCAPNGNGARPCCRAHPQLPGPTMAITVEHGIPLPPPSRDIRRSIYPFHQMQVGDSFFVPNKKPSEIGGAVTSATKTTGFQFTTRV